MILLEIGRLLEELLVAEVVRVFVGVDPRGIEEAFPRAFVNVGVELRLFTEDFVPDVRRGALVGRVGVVLFETLERNELAAAVGDLYLPVLPTTEYAVGVR